MDASLAPVAQSSFPDSAGPKKSHTIASVFKRGEEHQTKLWKSTALRAPVLIFTILICWAIIAVLQYLLIWSQRDKGIIFAPKINDLPLSRTFLYLYFPTIVAVIFSIYWAWIDLETKRLEPYYQLSKKDGALGKDSLLLHYPFDFVPLVPFKAAKDRHWPVFWASLAVVLVTWGVVPLQAGIFSVRTVTRTTSTTFAVSTSSIPIEQQSSTLNLGYMQSTYGIVSLNETLPQYMGRNYTLAPFRPSTDLRTTGQASGIWTARTTKYSLDLYCEDVSRKADNSTRVVYTSNSGCNFTTGLTGNVTKGNIPGYEGEAYANKDYVSMFVGYHNGGFADFSLDSVCDESSNTTFYAAFSKNKARSEDPPEDVTAVFCKPLYYQQAVMATVDMTTRMPLKVEPLTDKEPLPWHVFNTTMFETLLNAGSLSGEVRGDILPAKSPPRYIETIARARNGQLSLSVGAGSIVQPMVGLAIGAGTDTLESYLEWKGLSKAYAEAYRVLFARAMVDVLGNSFSTFDTTSGQQRVTSEAVVLESVFVYIVEGLLGLISIATIALLVLSLMQKRSLRTNMGTIASVMSIVADNEPLLLDFADLDCCPVEDMQHIIGEKRYKLINEDSRTSIIEIDDAIDFSAGPQLLTSGQRRDTPTNIAKPVRPKEFSLWVAAPFINLFIVLAVVLGVIFAKARANGLPLPSSNTIVQNILENYVPTAFATLIEPMWVLINRLLCMLRPLEELQGCNAKAKKSIDLDYSSLPPQLVIFKALKSKHYVLAAVCGMALLSNVLAVAFSGIFNQSSTEVRQPQTVVSIFDLKFVTINGSVGPESHQQFGSHESSGAYEGGNGEDQFLIAESNYTRGTPLPAWTDDRLFYRPFSWTNESGNSINGSDNSRMEATTQAFGAELDCEQLELSKDVNARIDVDSSIRVSINVTVPTEDGNVRCSSQSLTLRPGPISATLTCVTGSSAAELVSVLQPRINSTQREKDVCMGTAVMGWLREPQGLCPLGKNLTITESNSMFVRCRPKFQMGTATIRVDGAGRLVQKADNFTLAEIGTSNETLKEVFTNEPINLIGQSNKYLFKYDANGWHNDSFADDFMNYFVRRGSNSSRLIDPSLPPPTFEDVAKPLSDAYSKLFAIWLGTNKDLLLVKSDTPAPTLQAWKLEQAQHIFVSMPMFIIAEAILCIYTVAAVFVYLCRPGQYLARLPISIASMIALFAASSAVQDLQGTSHLDKKGRAQHLEAIDSKYGYGSFVGAGDGRVHIGIEKTPFVRVRSKTTWLRKRVGLGGRDRLVDNS